MPGQGSLRFSKLFKTKGLREALDGGRQIRYHARISTRGKIFQKPLALRYLSFGYNKNHVVFIDILGVAQLERAPLMSEDNEPKRRIEALGGSLAVTDREDDLLQRGKRCGAPQHFGHQPARNPLAAMLRGHINAPYPALMALFLARIASKTDRSDQFAGRESAQYIVIVAGRG